jgi:hypothetical protein
MTDQTDPSTLHNEISPAPDPALVKARQSGQKGGRMAKRNRHSVLLLGLGVPVPPLDLATREGRFALLGAVVEAVSGGKCSALTAQTLLAAVREGRAEAGEQWERLAHRQAEMIEELRSGKIIEQR